ncbi:outer membrane protein assembly factor BamB family protein [Nocardia goodfellowii]|uniref:Outer membrane protein assembly factor BamB n=1 Tax=Nocardia goodfellowii TaxID=882446 RepID=A0ABS4QII4_9NOCA|nr:PQQ-binding-like beta-propeller repeat protein [Nocardia goodfellowii]MBP2191521.1 outer membrane protein assembly factor BamB [Nocardia goodfellowii]
MNSAGRWVTGRRVGIVVLIVAVVAGVATVAWMNRSPRGPEETDAGYGRFKVSTRLDSAPVPQWTLRATDLSDEPGAVLLAMPHSLGRYYGYGSPMDAGTIIVAATAVPGEPGTGETSGRGVGPVRMHGIDPGTGQVRWTTDVGEFDGCREQVFDGKLACRGAHRVLIIEAATGAILGDQPTDFEVMDVTVWDGAVSVTGRTPDWMTAVLTRGTPTDIAATWRRTYPTPVPGDPVTPRVGSRDYFLDGHDHSVRLYDVRTGESLFAGPIVGILDGGVIAEQENIWRPDRVRFLDRRGESIGEVSNPSFVFDWFPTATAVIPPILTGESAYERTTGRVLWTNAQIGMEDITGRMSAVQGIVDNTVIVRSRDGSELSGLDLTDGHQIWRRPTPFANTSRYSTFNGITDPRHLILTDGTDVHAIDAADGATTWSMPLPPSGRPDFRTAIKAVGGRMVTTTPHEFTAYAAG